MLSLLIEAPWIALVPAIVLAIGAALLHSRTAWIAATLWAGYFAYESAMNLRWLCSGECNIRIDLLAIYPMLALITLVAAVQLFVHRRRVGRTSVAPLTLGR
jgi:hypothetical protein